MEHNHLAGLLVVHSIAIPACLIPWDFFISLSAICHGKSSISTLLNVSHFFFSASRSPPSRGLDHLLRSSQYIKSCLSRMLPNPWTLPYPSLSSGLLISLALRIQTQASSSWNLLVSSWNCMNPFLPCQTQQKPCWIFLQLHPSSRHSAWLREDEVVTERETCYFAEINTLCSFLGMRWGESKRDGADF